MQLGMETKKKKKYYFIRSSRLKNFFCFMQLGMETTELLLYAGMMPSYACKGSKNLPLLMQVLPNPRYSPLNRLVHGLHCVAEWRCERCSKYAKNMSILWKKHEKNALFKNLTWFLNSKYGYYTYKK
jgi:hypothetical protein